MLGEALDAERRITLDDPLRHHAVVERVMRVSHVPQAVDLRGGLQEQPIDAVVAVMGRVGQQMMAQIAPMPEQRKAEGIQRKIQIEHFAAPDASARGEHAGGGQEVERAELVVGAEQAP